MNEQINPHFYHFLAEDNIICGVKGKDSRELIEELATRLCKTTAGLDKNAVVEAVVAREEVAPTVIASGLAVPHARMEGVDKLLVALGISREGVDFNCPEMPPVKVAAMILTPKDDPGLHLQVLAALAKDFQNQEVIDGIAELRTPTEVMDYFDRADVEIPDYLKAHDLIDPHPLTLQESDSLNQAIETFATNSVDEIPVLDNEGDLRGVISREDILKFSLPEHILWMDDLTPIYRFQPFAEMLKDDLETNLADFMREEVLTVDEDIPAIQLAKLFMVHKVRQIIVTNNSGKLSGVVNIKDFVSKLFWQ